MSEVFEKELTAEELENVSGAGLLDDLYHVCKSSPSIEMDLLNRYKTGGKPALVAGVIEYSSRLSPHLTYLSDDVVGLLKSRWEERHYI